MVREKKVKLAIGAKKCQKNDSNIYKDNLQ